MVSPALDRDFSGGSIVVASQEQVSCDMDGDAVILDLKDGVYYELNSVGARVWGLIQQPRTIDEIRDILLEEYDVERERCERDIQELLRDMAAKGLIDIKERTDS
jgi:hypothetical protein